MLKAPKKFCQLFGTKIIFFNIIQNSIYLIDEFGNLILVYENTDFSSIENLKTFYHLYYKKLDESNKPINIIILERNTTNNTGNKNKNKVDINDGKKMSELYGGLFCDSNINASEFFLFIFVKCINNLKAIYDTENYNLFCYELKQGDDINMNMNYNITICGNNEYKNLFLKHFLKLKCNHDFERKKDVCLHTLSERM